MAKKRRYFIIKVRVQNAELDQQMCRMTEKFGDLMDGALQ